MLKVLLRTGCILIPLFAVSSGIAFAIGHTISTYVTAAVIVPGGSFVDREYNFHLIDINRNLHLNIVPPLDHVVDVDLLDGGTEALILTQRGQGRAAMNYLTFQRFNLLTGELYPLHTETIILNQGTIRTRSIRNDFAPRFSPDGRWLAFLDRENNAVHVVDVQRNTLYSTIEVTTLNNASAPFWSTDSSKLAIRSGNNSLLLTNIENDTRQEITGLDRGPFQPVWSPDGSTVLIQYLDTIPRPILWFDLETNTLSALPAGTQAQVIELCGSSMLAYLERVGTRIFPRVLERDSGVIHTFETHPLLRREVIVHMRWNQNCDGLILIGQLRAFADDYTRVGQPVYYADSTGSQVELLHQGNFVLDPSDRRSTSLYLTYLGFPGVLQEGNMIRLNFTEELQIQEMDLITDLNYLSRWIGDTLLYLPGRGMRRQLALYANGETIYLTDARDDVLEFVLWQ